MLIDVFYTLRSAKLPVSVKEYLTLLEALQAGVVDGAENPITAYLNNKFYEVGKYYTLDGHVFSPSIIVMSETTAKKLSADDLKLVTDAAVEAGQRVRASVQKREADGAAQLKAKGTVTTDMVDKKPWQDAVKPVVDKYAAQLDPALVKAFNAELDRVKNLK